MRNQRRSRESLTEQQQRRRLRRLKIEKLEDRNLLAGNVLQLPDLFVDPPPDSYRAANVSDMLTRVAYEYDLWAATPDNGKPFVPSDNAIMFSDGRVPVEAFAKESGPELVNELTQIGAEVNGAYELGVSASVPFSRLSSLSGLPELKWAVPELGCPILNAETSRTCSAQSLPVVVSANLAGTALHTLLDVGDGLPVNYASLTPDENVRIVGGNFGTAWDFDQSGRQTSMQPLGLLPGLRRIAQAEAVSPDGRWVAGQQFDFDYSPGHVQDSAFTRWDGADLTSFVRMDTATMPSGAAGVLDIANNGDVLFGNGYSAGFRWNATSGFTPVEPLPAATRSAAAAISADGSMIVGFSAIGADELPTYWTTAGPQVLPSLGKSGHAIAVSDDGRIIGGRLGFAASEVAVVWVDGSLLQLRDEHGDPVAGRTAIVVNGLAGVSDRWVAFGSSPDRQPWIAFGDGIAHPLDAWLRQHFDISLNGLPNPLSSNGGYVVMAAFVKGDVLEMVVPELMGSWCTASIPPSCGYAMTDPHLIVAPFDADGNPVDEHPLDVSGDGAVSPLDVLIIINSLNSGEAGPLANRPEVLTAWPRIDVSGDGQLTAVDALYVINLLNPESSSTSLALQLINLNSTVQDASGSSPTTDAGEGESPTMASDQALGIFSDDDDLFRNLRLSRRLTR